MLVAVFFYLLFFSQETRHLASAAAKHEEFPWVVWVGHRGVTVETRARDARAVRAGRGQTTELREETLAGSAHKGGGGGGAAGGGEEEDVRRQE